jgi:xanthine dehydrogenase molybdopterin-binding subunit B
VWEAIRDAVSAARPQSRAVAMTAPATPETVLKAVGR